MGDRSDPTAFENRQRRHISACNVSTVRASEKVQLRRIVSRLRAFKRAINEGRGLSLTPLNGGRNPQFAGFWNKSQLQLNEVCYKVSLTENFQRQSCSTFIPLSNGTYRPMLGEK